MERCRFLFGIELQIAKGVLQPMRGCICRVIDCAGNKLDCFDCRCWAPAIQGPKQVCQLVKGYGPQARNGAIENDDFRPEFVIEI